MTDMQAIIMAGGFGTRLRPLTSIIPKPMVPVVNKPMMEHVVRLLAAHGINDLIVLLFYQHEFITGYFGDGSRFGVRIRYLLPEGDLGTCGSVGFARDNITDENFMVISADIVTDFNLRKFVQYHEERQALATIALTSVENPLSYGIVIYGEDGRIKRFLEKPSWGEVFSDKVNTGIYMLNRRVFDMIPRNATMDFSKDLYPKMLEQNDRLYACVLEGYWRDVGTLQEYRFCHYDILDRKIKLTTDGRAVRCGSNDIIVGRNVHLGDNLVCDNAVIIGNDTRIGNNVTINRSIIGDRVVIEDGCTVFGSVIMDDVRIGAESSIKEDVISKGCRIGKSVVVEVNSVIGEECVIDDGAHVRANLKLWPKKTVEEGAVLSTSLVWQDKWSRMLFGSSGVTGLVNVEITPEFATKLGAAFGAMIGKGKSVITSRDSHRACRMIKRTMIGGLLSAGVKVGDLRTAPIPVVRYELGKENDAGGLHVRLSPRNPEILEIKFFDADGNDISIAQEKSIEQLFLREDFPRAKTDEVGEIVLPPRASEYYKDGYLKMLDVAAIRQAKLKVVLDYSYSSAVSIFTGILGELGVELVSLNAFVDPTRIVRSQAERTHALDQLSNIVTTLDADVGFMIDNSAERVYLVDDKGKILDPQLSALIVMLLQLGSVPRDARHTVAVPVYLSNVVREVTRFVRKEVDIVWSKTLQRHMTDLSASPGTVFVCDGLGGYIFPEFQPAFDGMFAVGKILELLAKEDTKLSRIKREIPDFNVLHAKLPCPWDKKGAILRRLVEEHQKYKMDLIDGVKVWLSDKSWLLFLPDPDEAFLNIYVEAQRDKDTQKLLDDYLVKLKQWLKD
jgi:mannose-1-phosphate guanylyltransferase/phosphomannomutase